MFSVKPLFLKIVICVLIVCMLFVVSSAFTAISDSDFISLCRRGSLQQVLDAIKNGANVNATSIKGETPLMHAAMYNPDLEVTKALIKAGADVNAKGSVGFAPLNAVILSYQNLEVIKILIEAGADVNAKDEDGLTPLFQAILINSNPEVVTDIINSDIDFRLKDKDGYEAFMSALMNVRMGVLMDTAKRKQNLEVIKTLIEAGADINARYYFRSTLLMEAASDSNPEVIIMLLKLGANPKAKDLFGNMAIDYARKNKKLENTEALKKLEEACK